MWSWLLEVPLPAALHERFAQVAATSEGAPAVSYEGREWSYGDLDRRSNQLAHALLRLGVGPEARVGLVMERSFEMLVGMLGVLKAGGAYVPLDPSYPRERLTWLRQDAEVSVLLTQSPLLDLASGGKAGARVRVLCLDDGELLTGASPESPAVPVAAENLAYIIYTSGSTGRPKGVQITHGNVLQLLAATAADFRFGREDVWTLFHSFSFDFSVWEIWGALLSGGRLVIVPYWVSRSPQEFHQLLAAERVTVLNQTPSAFRQLIAAARQAPAQLALRWVVLGGEALDFASLRPWFELGGDRRKPRLVNMYGITETTVHVTSRQVRCEDLPCEGRPARGSAIGRQLDHLSAHVLDAGFQLLPAGVPGELCVGGAGVARGYLKRPELTAERFIPDPWSGIPGGRLYRSGDLALRSPAGELVHLGRIDHQVKVRGFRIELGEIEAVLHQAPRVREAAVVAAQEQEERQLVAYVVMEPVAEAAGAAGEPIPALRAFARERLPEHMLPAAYVLLDALPLTAHGKLDRQALPAPDRLRSEPDLGRRCEAPRSPLETALAEIWSEALGVGRIGLDDSFFELGGDSIKAVRLVSRVNEGLSAKLRVQDAFRYQTVAEMAAHLAAVGDDRGSEDDRASGREQVERLRRSILADPAQRSALPPAVEDFYPLSGIERGMIFHSLLTPDEPVYYDQITYLFELSDLDRFYRGFELLVDRHAIFRSRYDLERFAEPLKVVEAQVSVARDVEDLTAQGEDEQRLRVEAYCAHDRATRPGFAGNLLWRLKLFRLRGDLHCLVLSFHHAMLDGWSVASFWVELDGLVGRPDLDALTRLPRLASDYRDYVEISIGRRRSPRTEAFWRDHLAGQTVNQLPFSRARRRSAQEGGVRSLSSSLNDDLLDRLRSLALAHRVSLQSILVGAHLQLLRVTTGEDDLVTGIVTHDRPGIRDGDKILGCFLNSLPLRIRMAGLTDGLELVQQVHRLLNEQKFHQIPLVDLTALVGTRTARGNPFFDTLFNLTDFHVLHGAANHLGHRWGDEAGRPIPYRFGSHLMTNTPFDVEVSATRGKSALSIKYAPRHFTAADVERAASIYRNVLERFAAGLAGRLSAEDLLSPSERNEILVRFNDTAATFGAPLAMHQPFGRQASAAPGRAAVLCAGRSLDYGDLARLTGRMARLLRERGVEAGDRVGLVLARSVDLAVGALAILQAGGAYVPMEPDYPAARKGYIAQSSGLRRILADRPYEIDPAPSAGTVLLLEDLQEAAGDGVDLGPTAGPEDLAYTIYTSGSTGRPKGVMVRHRSAMNVIEWVNRELSVGPGAVLLMLSSICFDLSVYDLFGGLAAGATVVLAELDDLRDPRRLARLIQARRITFWNSVPSIMASLVQYLEQAEPDFRYAPLTSVLLSGDWIPITLPDRIKRFFPAARVVSLGGATEAAVWSNYYPVGAVLPSWPSIPYGRPIANSSFHVLDRGLDLVPPGVIGDLYIGGAGVAVGYASDPEQTASSFLPDRFAAARGSRMYRTGDLGRMMPDGNLEFLGRADHQVKIRGFRIELGEIESVLGAHPEVAQAVVATREGDGGEQQLIAYFVPRESSPGAPELRAHCRERLPDYMVPNAWVALAALPLTPNGKVDRRALPPPGGKAGTLLRRPYLAPRSELERVVAAVWRKVLGIETIGVEDNFFEIGGQSLLLLEVQRAIGERTGREPSLVELFTYPDVASLARFLDDDPATAVQPVNHARQRAHLQLYAREQRRSRQPR
jgi:amino acid adenylation domain-containing protein